MISHKLRCAVTGKATVPALLPAPRPYSTRCLFPRSCTLPSLSSHPALNKQVCAAQPDTERAPEAVAVPVDEELDTPFLEPAVRSFALGVGAGVLLELVHVFTQMASLATAGMATGVTEATSMVLPQAEVLLESLAPLVGWDNLAAITCCALFYGMEVSAILPVLRDHPNDSKEAAKVITSLPTLPKRLLPMKLVNVKRAIYSLIALRNPVAALAPTSPFLDAPESSRRSGGGVGTAVLERPRTSPAPPPVGAPGGPMPPFPGGVDVLDQPRTGAPEGSVLAPAPPTKRKQKLPPRFSPPRPPPGPTPESGEAAPKRQGLKPGAWAPDAQPPLSTRARELKDRKAYLKNFWYVAALSQDVKDQPKEVKMLGRTLVLFRDETGTVKCLDNVCPHRGAPLSGGWTRDVGEHKCVVCPYHGWAFSGEGKLLEVPSSLDQSRLPKRPLVDAYPVVEQGGFVWMFFGSKDMPEAERPPIPFCSELTDPAWQPVYGEMEFDAPHWSVFDNALDMAHIHYLHNDSFGNEDKPIIMDMQVTRDTWGLEGSFRIHNKPVNPLWEWTAVESVPVIYKAFLPSTSYVKITLGAGVQMVTFVNTVPIDAHRAVNRFCLIRNFAGWDGFDAWAKNAMYKILSEDKAMVELLKPEGMKKEVSLEADLPQIAFRRLRQEWVNMGYTVDPEATEALEGGLDMP